MLKRLTDVRWIVASAQNIHLSATLFCTGGRLHPTKKVVVSTSSNKMIEKKIVKDSKLAKSVRKISDADFNYASKLLDESKKKFTLTDLLLTNVPDSQSPKTGRWHIPIIPEECQNGIFIPHKWLCVKP